MKQKLKINFISALKICLFFIFAFLVVFELYLFYLYPKDISFWGYLASIYQAAIGERTNQVIKVNLASYNLALFEKDKLVKEYKIAGIGHPKISPTPKGNFKVLSKEKSHTSTITGYIMPWSLRFYMGYYIHEIPVSQSGQRIETPYSLGCIRLPVGAAQEVYQWAKIGTRVEIY